MPYLRFNRTMFRNGHFGNRNVIKDHLKGHSKQYDTGLTF